MQQDKLILTIRQGLKFKVLLMKIENLGHEKGKP